MLKIIKKLDPKYRFLLNEFQVNSRKLIYSSFHNIFSYSKIATSLNEAGDIQERGLKLTEGFSILISYFDYNNCNLSLRVDNAWIFIKIFFSLSSS